MRVLGLERPAVDLAGPEPRQRLLREDDPLGDLELGDPALEEAAQILFAEAVLGMNNRDRHFAKPLVGSAEYRDLRDVRAGVAFGLDLSGGDILAAADDDLLFAVDDEQIAVLVEIADVAGADVAVIGEQRLGGFGVAPIAGDVRGAADSDLADFAERPDAGRPRRGSQPRCKAPARVRSKPAWRHNCPRSC